MSGDFNHQRGHATTTKSNNSRPVTSTKKKLSPTRHLKQHRDLSSNARSGGRGGTQVFSMNYKPKLNINLGSTSANSVRVIERVRGKLAMKLAEKIQCLSYGNIL